MSHTGEKKKAPTTPGDSQKDGTWLKGKNTGGDESQIVVYSWLFINH